MASQMNAWVELIPGMDKLVGYMRAQDKKIKHLQEENKKLQEHYDNSIHTDWIAEAAGEDPEYYRDVCCADTLGKMIKENKKLKQQEQEYQPKGSQIDPEGLHDYMKEEIDELKEEITEEMIVREYGDESLQAKKYGFGMYNPDYVKALDKSSSSDASMSESEDE